MTNHDETPAQIVQKVTKTVTSLPDGSTKVVTRTESRQPDGVLKVITTERTLPFGATWPDLEHGAVSPTVPPVSSQRTGPIIPPPAPVVQTGMVIKHDPRNIAEIATPLGVSIGNLEKEIEANQERLDYCNTMLTTETDPQVRATLTAESARLKKLIEKKKSELGTFRATAIGLAVFLFFALIALIVYATTY